MNLKFVHPVSKPYRIRVTYDSLSALARQGLGKSRLSPAEAEEVRAAVERHKQRQLAREQAPRDPLAESWRWLRHLQNILQDESGPIYRILHRCYRMPYSRWVDRAGTELTIKFGAPAVYASQYAVWHRRKPWKATELHMTLTVPFNWRSSVLAAGLADAGGLLTLAAEQVAQDAWQASWLVQGRGYDFRVESGYIVRCADGTYAHARTLQHARAIADKRAKAWAERIQSEERKRAEAQVQARLRELRDQLASMTREQIADAFGDMPITIHDSIRAGNCQDGTRQWCARWTNGRTSGTIREALATGAPLDEYMLRALTVAIARAK